MFAGTISSLSHEGGLLASFSGSSPALGSIIVDSEDGTYIGKIDAVLGGTEAPMAHIAHLDRQLNIPKLLGSKVKIRPKIDKMGRDKNNSQQRARNFERTSTRTRGNNDPRARISGGSRNVGRNNSRDNRGNFGNRNKSRFFDEESRQTRRFGKDKRSRSRENVNNNRNIYTDNDWNCHKCNNSNFSFRKECNRCGEPKLTAGSNDMVTRRNRQNNPGENRHSKPRRFRRARGKGPGHAHNKGPRPLNSRPRRKNRDD